MALSDILAAAEHGAALVYHEIVAIRADATTWTAGHPEIAPLIAAGTDYAVQALTASGLPLPAIVTAGTAVLAALKALAAADPTGTQRRALRNTRGVTLMRGNVLIAATCCGAMLGLAGCAGTAKSAAGSTAQDVSVIAAAAAVAPAIAATIPGASPTLLQDAVCASPTIAAMAGAVAAAPAGSSVAADATSALISALVSYAATHQAGGACQTRN